MYAVPTKDFAISVEAEATETRFVDEMELNCKLGLNTMLSCLSHGTLHIGWNIACPHVYTAILYLYALTH